MVQRMINPEGCERKLCSLYGVQKTRWFLQVMWVFGVRRGSAGYGGAGGRDWIAIGRSDGLFCKLNTHTKHQAFWVVWSEPLHWTYVFRTGSSNRSFTMKLVACTYVIFVTVSFPGLGTVGIFPGFAWRDSGKAWITSVKLVIVATEVRHRRILIILKALSLGQFAGWKLLTVT